MKNCFDIAQDVRSLINVPEVLSDLDGGNIYPHYRPQGSSRIDVVIGVLGADNEYIQNANVNIRIHAPNLHLYLTNPPGADNTQPNLVKLFRICELITPLLDEQYRDTFNTSVASSGEMFQDADGTWFCLIQVEYFSIQDKSTP